MLGEPLNNSVIFELKRRQKGLSRNPSTPNLTGKLDYSFSEMMTKTTYVRLVSPLFRTEIHGNLLERNDPKNYFNQTHWTDRDGRGKLPPPGITSIRTAYVGEGATINTIKEATIELKVYSNQQYTKVVPEFVRIGRILYLEFGWSNPRIDIIRAQAVPRDFLTKTFDENTGQFGVELNYEQASVFPEEFSLNTNGNSDVFVGTVTNYNAKLNQEGGYDISIDLKSAGHGLYHASTNKSRHEHIPLLNDKITSDPFANNLDERSGLILLSKVKANIQEVFSINSAFQFPVSATETVDQAAVFYIRSQDDTTTRITSAMKILTEAGFDVEPVQTERETELVKSDTAGVGGMGDGMILSAPVKKDVTRTLVQAGLFGFTAINKAYRDIIITCVVGDKVEIGREKLKNGEDGDTQVTAIPLYLNYYCSIKYIEDNILTRIFGTADANSETITTGVRSLYVNQEKLNAGITFPTDNSIPMLESNLMLIHKNLVPKSFTDVLINTEAMKSLLSRTTLGMYGSDAGKQERAIMAGYSKSIGKTLDKGLGFIIDTQVQSSDDSLNNTKTNPNHVQAKIRNMYVNVNLVQDSFLGKRNRMFCDRNFFPTIKRDGSGAVEEIDGKDYDWWFKDDVTYFQDRNVFFDKMACVGSLREGLMNMYNTISTNFHNFPNFEVGGNVALPGFLAVYDLRNSNRQDHFKFDVYSKDSIVKSLELNSKIPKNVELAATIGASTNFDLTDVLGGLNSGLDAELLQDLNVEGRATSSLYNPLMASSYGSTDYIKSLGDVTFAEENGYAVSINPGDSPGQVEYMIRQGIQNGQLNKYKNYSEEQIKELTLSVYDGATTLEYDDMTPTYTGQAEIEKFTDDAFNFLRVVRDPYKKSFQGISPTYVLQNQPATSEVGTKNTDNPDKEARDKYPDIISGLTMPEVAAQMDSLFTMTGKTSPKIGKDGAVINGIPVTNTKGQPDVATLKQFTLTHSTFVDNVDGTDNRKAKYCAISTHSDYQNYMDQLIYNDNVNSLEKLNNTISYFELSFKIDGISGIMPGQAFTISYLPDRISDNFFFIVKNIEQELTSNGWETTITGLMRRKTKDMPQPKKPSKLAKIIKKKVENDRKIVTTPKPKPKPNPVITDPKPKDQGEPLPEGTYPNRQPPNDLSDDPELSEAELAIPAFDDTFEDPPAIEDQGEPLPEGEYPPPADPVFDPYELTEEELAIPEFSADNEEFPDIEWEPLPPPPPFIPYRMVENETANIILQMTDGQANIQPFADAPKQEVKIYPKGRESAQPIIFSLGVTDVLSIEEFNNIRKTFQQSFGKDPIDLLNRLYTQFTYSDAVTDDTASNFGEWDKRETTHCYVANRKTEDGKLIADKIVEMQETLRAVGNDPNNTTDQDNNFVNDIVNSILKQDQRTRLTVLQNKKKNDRKNIVVRRPRPAPMNPALMRDPNAQPPGADPPPAKPKKKKKPKPKEPIGSYFGGLEWQNNLLYRLVPKWKTLGAVLGKKDVNITQADRIRVQQQGTYYKNHIMYGTGKESKPEDPVPYSVRRDFWDTMIEPRERGAHYDKSQKSRCRASEGEIKRDSSYNYLKRLTGTEGPTDVSTYQTRF